MSKTFALPNGLKPAEHFRNHFAITPDDDTPIELVTKTEYWRHVGRMLRQGDTIEVRPIDATYFATLYVLSADDYGAQVKVLQYFDLNASEEGAPDYSEEATHNGSGLPYEIAFKGAAKWCVIRKSDRTRVSEGNKTRTEAENWLAANQLG